MSDLFTDRECVLSECGTYRYLLRITWSDEPPACFLSLNPSVADAYRNDPTLTRDIDFARRWGCGGVLKLNIFAVRATDPREMKRHPDPIGPLNTLEYLAAQSAGAKVIVASWGKDGAHMGRGVEVGRAIPGMMCLGVTKSGQPRHPLYMKATTELRPWDWRGIVI